MKNIIEEMGDMAEKAMNQLSEYTNTSETVAPTPERNLPAVIPKDVATVVDYAPACEGSVPTLNVAAPVSAADTVPEFDATRIPYWEIPAEDEEPEYPEEQEYNPYENEDLPECNGFDISSLPDETVAKLRQDYLNDAIAKGTDISSDLSGAEDERKFLVENAPLLFVSKSADAWVSDAAMRPNPKQLWHTLWFENEVACLFADTNMGKSIYAVQIAEEIASRGRRVLYFDFELSDKQFQLRYTDPDTGELYRFSPGFIRAEFGDKPVPEDMAQMVQQIEVCALRNNCNIIILDNITWVCNRCESGDAAGELMQLLVSMKRRWDMSILCLAHTPKRAQTAVLTQNSLAGSKRIANFMDAIFAIGMDFTNLPGGRYIKQIKVRNCECLYGDNNVIRTQLVKDGEMLRMQTVGYAPEIDLLVPAGSEKESREQRIEELLVEGLPQREVARVTNSSLREVSIVAKQLRRKSAA